MKITGNTVGTPMPRANYNQTDPSKADYIVGRENIASKADEPLIVTGTFPTSYETANNIAKGTVASMSLSHTTKEMCEAFANGRNVRIKLVSIDYTQEFGGWGLKHAELVVSSATDVGSGMFVFSAYGFGYTRETNVGQYTTETTPLLLDYNLSPAGYLRTPVKGTENAKLVEEVIAALPQGNDPLIVTGTFPASWTSSSSGAMTSITNGMNLSHTLSEMSSAFLAGRDVLIRLTNSDSTYEFGNWNLRYAELKVYLAQENQPSAGYYNFGAFGMGYAENSLGAPETTPIRISCSMSQNLMIYTPVKA